MSSKSFRRVKSGLDSLDKIIDNIRIGDNVVWQVDTIDDYCYFAKLFAEETVREKHKIIYIRFADHPPILEESEYVKIRSISIDEGFETFTGSIHKIIEDEGIGAYYVFDSLSYIADAWATDLMLGNFFYITCPYLFELDTIAYFAIIRNSHSFKTIAKIRDTTQILIDIYKNEGKTYIHPLKAWKRYSPTMFFPHVKEGEQLKALTNSSEITKFFSKVNKNTFETTQRKLDFWDKIFIDAFNLFKSGDIDPQTEADIINKLCRLIIAREDKIINLCSKYISLKDLLEIKSRLIGSGFIGGKAAGMLLSRKILSREDGEYFNQLLEPHDSFFIGSDVFYSYLIENGCWKMRMEQKKEDKYFEMAKPLSDKIINGVFNEEIKEEFKKMLEYFGQSPIIVRSSSLLEDGFGNAFAGKYESVFCANQGSPEKRYEEFEHAVKTVFASTMSEDALAYRKHRNLDDKDEQMALLVQRVSGSYYNNYYLPELAGVAVSYNLYVWNENIKPEAGMVRLVYGLGTRAVDRVENDYPRIIALDDPMLQAVSSKEDIRNYSQKYVDLVDVLTNSLRTIDFNDLMDEIDYGNADMVSQVDHETTAKLREIGIKDKVNRVLTFEKVIKETKFIEILKRILNIVQKKYENPVDIEFTVNFLSDLTPQINIVQCRPLQTMGVSACNILPGVIDDKSILFKTKGRFMGSNTCQVISRVIMVNAERYTDLNQSGKYEVARTIGLLNRKINDRDSLPVMLIGPGRWGTSTPSLGVPVSFSEINKISVLCEMAYNNKGIRPDISFGSHFFQDLVESNIFYTALFPEEENSFFNTELFDKMKDIFIEIMPDRIGLEGVIHVYDIPGIKIMADISTQELICFIQSIV